MTKENSFTSLTSSMIDGGITAPADQGADEWRDCGVYGLQCTRDGRFRNAKGKELKVFFHRNGLHVFACHDGKASEYICRTLIARAWLPDYYDGCGLKYLDGDNLNIHADNTEVCNMTEYRSWMAKMQCANKSKELVKEHGEFRDCGIDGISIAKDGYCLCKDILYKPHQSRKYSGKKHMNVRISVKGKLKYYSLADLMARAWLKTKYYEGCYILYRDYDNTNINPDNLRIANSDSYNRYISSWNEKHKLSIEGEIEKLENIKKQCDMGIHFLKTGDFSEINKWVQDYLFNLLMDRGRKIHDLGKEKCFHYVCLAIEQMYILLDTNRGVYQLEWYADKRLRSIIKYGEEIHQKLPTAIERAITSLELEALKEKYNTNLKTKNK